MTRRIREDRPCPVSFFVFGFRSRSEYGVLIRGCVNTTALIWENVLVSQIFTRWNRMAGRLRKLEGRCKPREVWGGCGTGPGVIYSFDISHPGGA
jgi:hypothetical protein